MLTPDQIDDFVNLTLKKFIRNRWTDIALKYQKYCSSKMIREKRVMYSGGEQINWKLKTRNTGTARNTGLYATDITKVEDVSTDANVPWTKQTCNWSYDIDESLFQSEREMIVRILTMREHDAMSDLAELQEQNIWSAPLNAADRTPWGVPFWLVKDLSGAFPEGAFKGLNPPGFPGGAAGVDSNQYPRWSNWTFQYQAVSRDDMVRKVKKAIQFTYFQPPVPHPETGYGNADYEIYSTYRVQEPLERLAETRNDNMGNDLAKYMNQVVIGGVPLMWVPYLEDNDPTDPLYGVNWGVFRPFVKTSANMRRSPPKVAAKQHSVREVHIDHWMNYLNVNRRETFVGHLSA